MAQQKRSYFIFPLIVLIFSVLGGLYGPKVQVAAAAAEDDTDLAADAVVYPQDTDAVKKLFDVVGQNFAEPVIADNAIYKAAIPRLLRTLDPQTRFFRPR